jgi:hypothetical protein
MGTLVGIESLNKRFGTVHPFADSLILRRSLENDANLALTLIYEHTHALLHFDIVDDIERS